MSRGVYGICGWGQGEGGCHLKACPRRLDFRHNRSLSRGEWNKIKACPGPGEGGGGGVGEGGGGC